MVIESSKMKSSESIILLVVDSAESREPRDEESQCPDVTPGEGVRV